MKTKILILVLLITNLVKAQTAIFSIDEKNYTIEKTDTNHIIDASWRLDHLQLNLKMPSKGKEGKYDRITIETAGRDIKTYPIGADAKKIVDKTGSEEGCGTVGVAWFDEKQSYNKSSDTGYMENSSGYIIISKIVEDKVSGSFQANIAGTKVSGSFEHVKVKSW